MRRVAVRITILALLLMEVSPSAGAPTTDDDLIILAGRAEQLGCDVRGGHQRGDASHKGHWAPYTPNTNVLGVYGAGKTPNQLKKVSHSSLANSNRLQINRAEKRCFLFSGARSLHFDFA